MRCDAIDTLRCRGPRCYPIYSGCIVIVAALAAHTSRQHTGETRKVIARLLFQYIRRMHVGAGQGVDFGRDDACEPPGDDVLWR